MIKGGNTHIDDPAHVWGSPDIQGNIKTFFNLGMDLDVDRQVYAFGNYARRKVTTGFFYREPEDEAGVFALDKEFTVEPYEVDPYDHDDNSETDPKITTRDNDPNLQNPPDLRPDCGWCTNYSKDEPKGPVTAYVD